MRIRPPVRLFMLALLPLLLSPTLRADHDFTYLSAMRVRSAGTDPILVGAGDIVTCGGRGEATAKLLDKIPGTVFTLGDNVYPDGTTAQFRDCYARSWGRHTARTRPAAGNHDYHTAGAAGYFTYFGAAAGDPRKGYYSYALGAWHIVVLNSNCAAVGGCAAGSPQVKWLQADLAAHPARCTLAMAHHPRFSSGNHGSIKGMHDLWQTLYDAGVDVFLAGHDHSYERFAPQDPQGRADAKRGIREFVVGTGGRGLDTGTTRAANSQVFDAKTHGVLKLTLHPTSYEWQFVPVAGQTFTDAGSGACH
jgi:3',5'-cyclic AMP phosphodiesterase CpdA